MEGRIHAGKLGFMIFLLTCLLLCSAAPLYATESQTLHSVLSGIDQEKSHFVVISDTQRTSHWEFWRERNDKERKLLTSELLRRQPAFVLHMGDITARGSSARHWQEFDDWQEAFRANKLPLFPVLGNHELYGKAESALSYYFSRFPYLQNKRWYSFVWKNVAFVMLDSNFATLTAEQHAEQLIWYAGELDRYEKDAGIAHIIVSCHEPPYSNNTVVSPSARARTLFAEPFIHARKTRFFLSGHSHSYEHFEQGAKTFVVAGGGGGPRHAVDTDVASRRYDDQYSGDKVRFFHFGELRWQNDTLALSIYRLHDDGTFTIADTIVK